jgi:hypothetical protein
MAAFDDFIEMLLSDDRRRGVDEDLLTPFRAASHAPLYRRNYAGQLAVMKASFFLEEVAPLRADPPPWWSVQQESHKAITFESILLTACSQCRGGSDGSIDLRGASSWDFTSNTMHSQLNVQHFR